MASNFFAQRKRKSRIDLTAEEPTNKTQTSDTKKKYSKFVQLNNFTKDNVNERVNNLMNRHAQFVWRRRQTAVTIPFTIVTQKWEFDGKVHEIHHFTPWGTQRTTERKLTAIQVKTCFNSLPNEVKEHLVITQDNFVRDNILVTAHNSGYQNEEPFVRIFCTHCEKLFLPRMLNNQKFGNCKTLEELLLKWDDVGVPAKLFCVIGCFLCTTDPKIFAGPNKKHFLKEPKEHIKTYHPEIEVACITAKQEQFRKDIQTLLTSSTSEAPPQLVCKLPEATASSSTEAPPGQTILTSKYFKKTSYKLVSSSMVQKLSVSDKSTTKLQKVARGYAFSVVHSGVNRRVAESITLETYTIGYQGIYDHYMVQEQQYKSLNDVGDDTVCAEVPQECCLDKNNILKYEKCILKAYQEDPNGLFKKVTKDCQYWGIMHDGIQKFSIEYNGMFISAVDPDTFKLMLLPFRLMPMKGGPNAHDVIQSLFLAFHKLLQVDDSAFVTVRKNPDLENCADIPVYFKLGKLQSVQSKEIHIEMSDRLPIANCGDGVGVNVKASRVGSQLYGLPTPALRCAAHSVDGCWKRIAKSETMSVEEVKNLYGTLKTIVKHFKFSGKSKELLDASMKMLDMAKGIHLVTWCATRMAHFLVACKKVDDLLVPVYNTMYSENLKQEERDKLFQADNLYTLKVVADVHEAMHKKLLRSVDKSESLVSTTYFTSQASASEVIKMNPPSAEKFLNSLSLDGNGNLMFEELFMGNPHSLRLTNTHHPRRGQTEEDRLQQIRISLVTIKDKILNNIHENLQDQIGEETQFYTWSGLDLSDKTNSLEQRLEKLEPLLELFTNDRIHEVQKYRTAKEDGDTVPFIWEGRKIYLHYQKSIPCSHDVLANEIKTAWPFVSRSWLKFKDKTNQRKFLEEFLSGGDAGIRFPNFCCLIMILLSTPANTSPLERSYSGLEMICTPRRNHISKDHLECLYLLSSLQLPVKKCSEYQREIELLENSDFSLN